MTGLPTQDGNADAVRDTGEGETGGIAGGDGEASKQATLIEIFTVILLRSKLRRRLRLRNGTEDGNTEGETCD